MCEERWSPEPSVVGVSSVHRRPDPEPDDASLDFLAEETVIAHAAGDCPACRGDACDVLRWAIAWRSGERWPYPSPSGRTGS